MNATNPVATFAKSFIAHAIARAFTPPPDMPIWQFADENVWLQTEDAAEAGPYRSAKTAWTRRLQELARNPFMWCWDHNSNRWVKVQVTQINIQKSTQSGFTEAVLNIIRWIAKFLIRNVLYAIDSLDEAKKIARRLLRSLKKLDADIFTGDADDIKSTEFLLRGMELLFVGSFASGKFANKQAWLVVNDEVEEHNQALGNTSTTRDSFYRGKTHDEGIQINLGKPKLENGPINKLFKTGNREEFHIECPHCHHLQPVTNKTTEYDSPFSDKIDIVNLSTGAIIGPWKGAAAKPRKGCNVTLLPRPLPLGETRKVKTGRLVYDHCKDLLGNWDELRIMREIYFECAKCKGKIEEWRKGQLANEAAARDLHMLGWLPTAIGSPGIVSQRMGDLLSTDKKSSWGMIILELINAKKVSRQELQGVINNRFGNAWREELNKTEQDDIRANVAGKTLWFVDIQTDKGNRREMFQSQEEAKTCKQIVSAGGARTGAIIPSFCAPYKRGNIPFVPQDMILGSDVGGNYARWVLTAVMENLVDVAVIDWGDELDPETIGELMLNHTWPCLADGKKLRIGHGFIDAKFRRTEVMRVCWHVFKNGGHRLIPTAGIGGAAARGVRVWAYTPISGYQGKFLNSHFKKLDFNDREAKNDLYIGCINKKQRRIFFPVELGQADRDLTADERQFIRELCAEELVEDKHGRTVWNEFPSDPNHYGDALKNAIKGLRFLTRKHHASSIKQDGDEAAEEDVEALVPSA